ncbi:MAG: hypothetical protein FWH07_04755 [Oscillospiraceae bacterium]|nr:hypothetical protein [Oscillospiraceae bacterium]
MKKLKTISALSLAIITLTSCTSNETPPIAENTVIESSATAGVGRGIETIPPASPEEIQKALEERGRDDFEEIKKRIGVTKEDTLDSMLDKDGWWSNIVLGTAVEITDGKDSWGIIAEGFSVEYSFKISDNLTGIDLPEYITVKSQLGDILELGKEYCISPLHNYNSLWSTHIIARYAQVISRELLTDSEIEEIRKSTSEMGLTDYHDTVVQNASTDSDFLSRVDLAALITINGKQKDENSETIFDVMYKLDEVLYFDKKYEKFLSDMIPETGVTTVNSDVEVGETYLVMFVARDDGTGGYFTMPAARNGAVVSVLSPDYERYRLAFLVRVQ